MTCMNQGKPKCQKAKRKNPTTWIGVPILPPWMLLIKLPPYSWRASNLKRVNLTGIIFEKTARWTKYSLGCPPSPIIVTSKILTFLGLKQSQPKPTHLSHWAHSHASSATPFRMKGDDCTRYHLDQWMISKSIQVSKKNHDQSTNPVVSWQSVSTKKIKAWR